MTAVSALLVKQHYLVDLPAGLFLGIFSYRLAFSERLENLVLLKWGSPRRSAGDVKGALTADAPKT